MVDSSISKKSRRGRPLGTCLDDQPTLIKAANLLVENPRMKPTTAFKQIIKDIGSSDLRRLQVKWKSVGQRLMVEAHDSAKRRLQQPKNTARGYDAGISSRLSPYGHLNDPLMQHINMMGSIDKAVMRGAISLNALSAMNLMDTRAIQNSAISVDPRVAGLSALTVYPVNMIDSLATATRIAMDNTMQALREQDRHLNLASSALYPFNWPFR